MNEGRRKKEKLVVRAALRNEQSFCSVNVFQKVVDFSGGVDSLRNICFKVGTCATELLKLGIDRKYLNLGSRVRVF